MIYPTIEKIRELSGEDLTVLLGSSEKANAYIRQFSDIVYEELMRVNTAENYSNIIGLIKADKNWQDEFFRVVGRLVFMDFNLEVEIEKKVIELVENSRLLRLRRVIV